MKASVTVVSLCLLLTALLAGCLCQQSGTPAPCGDPAGGEVCGDPKSSDLQACAVICGLTRVDPRKYNGWDGNCPGCDVDAQTFALACLSNGVSYELLANAQCTAANVEAKAREAVSRLSPGGLLILYYSGHGGQVSDPGDASETDGKSETLCLWDGQLSDNIVWSLLCQIPAGIRVWMITDSCNSGTNYRGVHNYASAIRSRSRDAVSNPQPSLLHWGGCSDGRSSYGSAQGGTFTTALVDAYSQNQSYAAWFEGARKRMPANQRPTCEFTGPDFRERPAFR